MIWSGEPFHGAKALVFAGENLIILERDHSPGIAWPGFFDLPGGGREGRENPDHCVRREVLEEIGLELGRLLPVACRVSEKGNSFFFAAHLPASAVDKIVFGGEGAGWRVMSAAAFLASPKAIPHFKDILRAYKMPGWEADPTPAE